MQQPLDRDTRDIMAVKALQRLCPLMQCLFDLVQWLMAKETHLHSNHLSLPKIIQMQTCFRGPLCRIQSPGFRRRHKLRQKMLKWIENQWIEQLWHTTCCMLTSHVVCQSSVDCTFLQCQLRFWIISFKTKKKRTNIILKALHKRAHVKPTEGNCISVKRCIIISTNQSQWLNESQVFISVIRSMDVKLCRFQLVEPGVLPACK